MRTSCETLEMFDTTKEVLLGGILNPLIVLLVPDKAIKDAKERRKYYEIWHRRKEIIKVIECYTNDTVLIAMDGKSLKENLEVFRRSLNNQLKEDKEP